MKSKFIELKDDSNEDVLINVDQIALCKKHDSLKEVCTLTLTITDDQGKPQTVHVKGEYAIIKNHLLAYQ